MQGRDDFVFYNHVRLVCCYKVNAVLGAASDVGCLVDSLGDSMLGEDVKNCRAEFVGVVT